MRNWGEVLHSINFWLAAIFSPVHPDCEVTETKLRRDLGKLRNLNQSSTMEFAANAVCLLCTRQKHAFEYFARKWGLNQEDG